MAPTETAPMTDNPVASAAATSILMSVLRSSRDGDADAEPKLRCANYMWNERIAVFPRRNDSAFDDLQRPRLNDHGRPEAFFAPEMAVGRHAQTAMKRDVAEWIGPDAAGCAQDGEFAVERDHRALGVD